MPSSGSVLWKRLWVLKSKAGVLLAAEDEEGREGRQQNAGSGGASAAAGRAEQSGEGRKDEEKK